MEIRSWMETRVHSVKPLDSIQHARESMTNHRINQLPVIVDGRLVGIVTDRDLRDAFPSVFDAAIADEKRTIGAVDPRAVKVEMVMAREVITVEPTDSITDAARLMRSRRIGALPVVEKDRVVGIVTRSDILDYFIDLAEIEHKRANRRSAGRER